MSSERPWQQCYAPALEQGIELVNRGELHKLVLAVRQSIALREPSIPCLCSTACVNSKPAAADFSGNAAMTMSFSASPRTFVEPAQWPAAMPWLAPLDRVIAARPYCSPTRTDVSMSW